MIIRPATPNDAEPLLDIYRPIVLNTTISFELEPPTLEQFRHRIEKGLAKYDWLVAELNGRPIAYAYGTSHRSRAAYQYAVETSAYVHPDYYRQGIGITLYPEDGETVEDLLKKADEAMYRAKQGQDPRFQFYADRPA